ncbi:ATP-dependent DNA helicase MER3 [Spathaspora sp. JA1]|nr:ATP-dependent DNA helicase MER3 [Spathaspora sp. JA1]
MSFLNKLDNFLNEETIQDEDDDFSDDQHLVANLPNIQELPSRNQNIPSSQFIQRIQGNKPSLLVPRPNFNQISYAYEGQSRPQAINQNSYSVAGPPVQPSRFQGPRFHSQFPNNVAPPLSTVYTQIPTPNQRNTSTRQTFRQQQGETPADSSFDDAYQTSYHNITSSNKLNINVLPPSQRNIFSFSEFNEMQSKCFPIIYNSGNNCIISAPTGSGKTVLFELAILREFGNTSLDSNFKVLYLAPTKALCNERQLDWSNKFKNIGLTVGTLTGDTSFKESENVRKSHIIISTPEKWDMITRKWTDYKKLFGLIKILLIDEIHVLKESRGSTLEVVITRMKRLCNGLRILAISATVANAQDLATWLKLNGNSDSPAESLCFGDEYRSVKLHKIVYGYKSNSENDFQFDMMLNSKLHEVIIENSKNKPVLIFCPTRNSCQLTVKFLFNSGILSSDGSCASLKLKDRELFKYVQNGVAYHHAGLSFGDRKLIENSFISGKIKYLCSTSTLAMGINLPAYLVIIKGTKCWADGMFREYSETDILQMMGRAGRPQFENEGVSVIMTNVKLKQKYETIVKGTEKIESSLHLNFPENLAAEIFVGSINNLQEALQWLKNTYLYVRFIANPAYYIPSLGVECKSPELEETLIKFCRLHANALLAEKIITIDNNQIYACTKYGQSMTMHYIMFETMKIMIKCKFGLTISEIFDLLASFYEFTDYKLKHQEKRLFKELNSYPMIRYPSKTKDSQSSNKLKLIIQFELGGLEFPKYNGAMKLHSSFLSDKLLIFKQLPRLMMAMLDVMVEKADSITLRNSSYLYRCINGKCWEDSPNELRQLEGVGPVAVKNFIEHNILCLEHAQKLSSTQIENILGWKIGAGNKLRHNLQALPYVELSLSFVNGKLEPSHTCVTVTFSVEIKVINPKEASSWRGKPVYIQIITDLNNGHLIDFRRIPIFKFSNSESKKFQLNVTVSNLNQIIKCQASAETIASIKVSAQLPIHEKLSSNITSKFIPLTQYQFDDDFSDSEEDIPIANSIERNITGDTSISSQVPEPKEVPTRKMLDNGNFKCNHTCKDKLSCRHYCCKDGISAKNASKNDKQNTQAKSSQNSQLNKQSRYFNKPPNIEQVIPKPITNVANIAPQENLFVASDPTEPEEVPTPNIPQDQTKPVVNTKPKKKMIQLKRTKVNASSQDNMVIPQKRNIFDDSDSDSDLDILSLFKSNQPEPNKKNRTEPKIMELENKVKQTNVFSIQNDEPIVRKSSECFKVSTTVPHQLFNQIKEDTSKSSGSIKLPQVNAGIDKSLFNSSQFAYEASMLDPDVPTQQEENKDDFPSKD